mgnify:CR=1 FL=1
MGFPLNHVAERRLKLGDVLDEAYAIAQCKECPWYKSCVSPMKFTAEDIRRQLESSAPGMSMPPEADLGMQNLIASMATAAQNSLLEACPVFINRLRASPKLSQRLKEMMQNWGREEEPDTK